MQFPRNRIGSPPGAVPKGRPKRTGHAAFLALLSALLAACGGDSGSADGSNGPRITSFTADRTGYFVGDSARLTVRFSGGAGRIEPVIGPVQDGATIETPVLDVSQRFRLIVAGDGKQVEREIDLPVTYRDQYRALAESFPAARHTATLIPDGRVVVIGGSRGQTAISNAIDRFDPATGRFTRIGSLATGREEHTATRLSDGRILVVGGSAGLSAFVPAELVDERTGSVTPAAQTIAERRGHTATLLASGDVLVVGGYTNEGMPFGISDTAEIWDRETGKFRAVSSRLVYPRATHTATELPDGRVLIAGGFAPATHYVLGEIFDPVTETFEPVPGVQRVRGLHHSVRISNGGVLVIGGEDALESHASVLQFEPQTGSWLTMPNLMRGRSVVRAVSTRDDRVLLFGGETLPDFRKLASAETYTTAAGSIDLAPLPAARAWHTTTRLNDGRVLIVGGEAQNGALVGTALLYE
ncbi:MAG TPA: kelch repeat-containing protein [Steroidobacteraceae bacterium]|nr:kelch repeat-containing protein [Steroidobacteraceae bacterium]